MLCELNERVDDRRMGDVRRTAPQRIEIGAPIGADRGGIGEVGLVLLLDKRRIAAEKRAAALEFLHRAHGVTCYVGPGAAYPSWNGGGSSALRAAARRGGRRRYRADAAAQSSGRGPRSSRSTARSSPRCVPARRSR